MVLDESFLKANQLLENNEITDNGWKLFSIFLDYVGAYPNLTPGLDKSPYGIFEKFMSKIVPTAMELLIVRDGKIFLTWRDDKFFRGWHMPGSYVAPRETLIQTAQRIINREVADITVIDAEIVVSISHPDSARFHDISDLVLIKFEGNLKETEMGKWFDKKPTDLLDCHEPFWPTIERILRQ